MISVMPRIVPPSFTRMFSNGQPEVNKAQFINQVIKQARLNGYNVNFNRNDLQQIDFGNKTLHTDQIGKLFPHVLEEGAQIANEIDKVAPGRPCTHAPMKAIIASLRE
jgi:hypothetical protein